MLAETSDFFPIKCLKKIKQKALVGLRFDLKTCSHQNIYQQHLPSGCTRDI